VVLSVVALVLLVAVLQILPFGGERSNPPVTAKPQWDNPRTRCWVEQTGRTNNDCVPEPAGKLQKFRSVEGSIVIKWCDACEWHSVEERLAS
jgi:hypothetical protein